MSAAMADAFDFGTSLPCSGSTSVRTAQSKRPRTGATSAAFRIERPPARRSSRSRTATTRSHSAETRTRRAEKATGEVTAPGRWDPVGGGFGRSSVSPEGVPASLPRATGASARIPALFGSTADASLRGDRAAEARRPLRVLHRTAGRRSRHYPLGIFGFTARRSRSRTRPVSERTRTEICSSPDGASRSDALIWSGVRQRPGSAGGNVLRRRRRGSAGANPACDATSRFRARTSDRSAGLGTAPLGDGQHELKFVATDSAGNPTP